MSGWINDDLITPSLHGKHSEWWRLEVIINPIARISNVDLRLFRGPAKNYGSLVYDLPLGDHLRSMRCPTHSNARRSIVKTSLRMKIDQIVSQIDP